MSNAETARRLYQTITDHDPEAGAALVADDAEWTDVPTGQTYRGKEGWRQQYHFWLGAFPDGQVEITNLVDGGDWVVIEYTGRGTNTGPLLTPEGELPATNRSVELPFCDVSHFSDGKFAGGRSYYDLASMMTQLGLGAEVPAGAIS